MTFQAVQYPACIEIPKLQRFVTGCGDGASSIGRHRHGEDGLRMAFQGSERTAGLQVPKLQGVVPRSGDGPLAIRHDGYGRDRIGVAFQRAQRVAGLQIQTLSVWSHDAETARMPSGVTATP